ncbi:hypothetical protein SAICODRAFT_5832 [Saitoella complicata NRRL Y-17804]|nr:uncharacterized protein SAICODRAFT_5832 [Saitoella complicata NRRL Y-17804]ODQ54630.1 hypothetical protein SAICODRAFT_5832 [Saitoella complicata NRRL Y-17804]
MSIPPGHDHSQMGYPPPGSGVAQPPPPQQQQPPVINRQPTAPKFEDSPGPEIKQEGGTKAKRRCVTTACFPCRRRKSKCDGGLPVCLTCQLYKTECAYDTESDRRRNRTHSRQHVDALKIRVGALEALITSLQSCPRDKTDSLLSYIRDTPLETLILDFDPANNTPQNAEGSGTRTPIGPSLVTDLSEVMGQLRVDDAGELRFFGPTSNLNLVEGSEKDTPATQRSISLSPRAQTAKMANTWYDSTLVSHLLELYWTWQHPYFVVLDRTAFMRDYHAGGGKYYSELLLNAILAHAAPYSSRSDLRDVGGEVCTAGYHFYQRARELLEDELEKPSITTVQALALLGSREAGCGRDARGWIFSGMSFRMALDLGLHLDCRRFVEVGAMRAEEAEIRSVTFWGCYVFDKGWSTYMGRPSLIPADDVTVPKPNISLNEEALPWRAYYEPSFPIQQLPDVPLHLYSTFGSICSLTEILGSLMQGLYSSSPTKVGASGRVGRVGEIWTRLRGWEDGLEGWAKVGGVGSGPGDVGLPSVVLMHMMYHTTVILLFRPFLAKKEPVLKGTALPRQMCTNAAMAIANLLTYYRQRFSLRYVVNLSVHILFTACTIHLVDATVATSSVESRAESRKALRVCSDGLAEISNTWESASRSLRVVGALARKWNVGSKDDFPSLVPPGAEGLPSPEMHLRNWQPVGMASTPGPLDFFADAGVVGWDNSGAGVGNNGVAPVMPVPGVLPGFPAFMDLNNMAWGVGHGDMTGAAQGHQGYLPGP